jgi:hypothetical protein
MLLATEEAHGSVTNIAPVNNPHVIIDNDRAFANARE